MSSITTRATGKGCWYSVHFQEEYRWDLIKRLLTYIFLHYFSILSNCKQISKTWLAIKICLRTVPYSFRRKLVSSPSTICYTNNSQWEVISLANERNFASSKTTEVKNHQVLSSRYTETDKNAYDMRWTAAFQCESAQQSKGLPWIPTMKTVFEKESNRNHRGCTTAGTHLYCSALGFSTLTDTVMAFFQHIVT